MCLGDHVPRKHDITSGVSQGSCLAPLVPLYMLSFGIFREHNVSLHSYADDATLHISVEPSDASSSLTACLSAINE